MFEYRWIPETQTTMICYFQRDKDSYLQVHLHDEPNTRWCHVTTNLTSTTSVLLEWVDLNVALYAVPEAIRAYLYECIHNQLGKTLNA